MPNAQAASFLLRSSVSTKLMAPQHSALPADPPDATRVARLLWARGSWRCFLTNRSAILYSDGRRLLAKSIDSEAEGRYISDIWRSSIERLARLANEAERRETS